MQESNSLHHYTVQNRKNETDNLYEYGIIYAFIRFYHEKG
jgi:hypothetical protein